MEQPAARDKFQHSATRNRLENEQMLILFLIASIFVEDNKTRANMVLRFPELN